MAEAIVLGSGTSNGVPMLGVRYSDSFLADSRNHRTRPSLLLSGPSGNVLVDCSPEMRLQLLRERVFDIEAVIVTHTHADHIMGMDDLRSFCIARRRPMPIYTLPAYQDDIRRVFSYAFAEHADGIEVPRFDLRDMPQKLEIASLDIETFLVDHGSWPVVGIRVEGLAYLTDVNRIPSGARAKLRNLDVLIMDAVRYKPHPNHFHFEQAVEEALLIGAKTTYFTHLSHDYDHGRVEDELPPQIRLAYDGLRIPL